MVELTFNQKLEASLLFRVRRRDAYNESPGGFFVSNRVGRRVAGPFATQQEAWRESERLYAEYLQGSTSAT